jgi:hypothetical protein
LRNVWQWPTKIKAHQTFLTFISDIQELANWLKSFNIYHVAVESTGIYWKQIFNIFEGDFDVKTQEQSEKDLSIAKKW